MKIMNRIKITENRVVACFAAILLLLPATAGAQHFDAHIAGRKVTLQECFDLAARQNLQMQAGKKSVERAQVMQGTAWELDKTEVAFSQNPATGGESDNGFTFTQSLDFPTVYASRRNQLKAETQAEKSRLNVVNQQLKAEIANTYYQMLYQTHRLQILQRIDSVLERYSKIAEMRYKAGESRQLEYLSADRKCNENRLEMADVKSEIERLQIDLMSQLNTQEPVKPAEENLSAIAAQNLNSYNYQQSADGIYQQDKLIALDKEIKAAKTGFAPSLSLSLRTQCVISSWNPYNIDRSRFAEGNFFGFEIGVGIPLFYGSTKAKVKAAQKDRELAEIEMRQEQTEKERDFRLCTKRLQAASNRLKYYEQNNQAHSAQISKLSAIEYENGEISYVEYVNAIEETIDVLMKHADAINEYNQAVIAIQRLTGIM